MLGSLNAGTLAANGSLVDDGVISGGTLTLGLPVITAGGHGDSAYFFAEFTGSLAGTGTITVQTGGQAILQEPVTTPGLTFQLDGDASLAIEASVGAGNTIDLAGNANTLTINDQWYLQEHPAEAQANGHITPAGRRSSPPPSTASTARTPWCSPTMSTRDPVLWHLPCHSLTGPGGSFRRR